MFSRQGAPGGAVASLVGQIREKFAAETLNVSFKNFSNPNVSFPTSFAQLGQSASQTERHGGKRVEFGPHKDIR